MRQGAVRAEDVRQMLGLADRSRIIDLFDALMHGDIARALADLREQYDCGADPLVMLTDLAEFTHFVTRVKIVPAVAEDRSLAEVERRRGRDFAVVLSTRVLSRTWQMLFKGLAEVKDAPRPIAAAEMVLVRIAYAADLPSPEEAVRCARCPVQQRRGRPRRWHSGNAGGARERSGPCRAAHAVRALAPSLRAGLPPRAAREPARAASAWGRGGGARARNLAGLRLLRAIDRVCRRETRPPAQGRA